jgi:hypothetical protein
MLVQTIPCFYGYVRGQILGYLLTKNSENLGLVTRNSAFMVVAVVKAGFCWFGSPWSFSLSLNLIE